MPLTQKPWCLNNMILPNSFRSLCFVTQCLLQQCKQKANQPSDCERVQPAFSPTLENNNSFLFQQTGVFFPCLSFKSAAFPHYCRATWSTLTKCKEMHLTGILLKMPERSRSLRTSNTDGLEGFQRVTRLEPAFQAVNEPWLFQKIWWFSMCLSGYVALPLSIGGGRKGERCSRRKTPLEKRPNCWKPLKCSH